MGPVVCHLLFLAVRAVRVARLSCRSAPVPRAGLVVRVEQVPLVQAGIGRVSAVVMAAASWLAQGKVSGMRILR